MIDRIFDFIDQRYITRRLMTIGTFLLVMKVTLWSLDYATISQRPGTDVGLILAAIMAPLNALMGYMFQQYVRGTSEVAAPVAPAASPPAVVINNQGSQ